MGEPKQDLLPTKTEKDGQRDSDNNSKQGWIF
jgi:hypothetical protein